MRYATKAERLAALRDVAGGLELSPLERRTLVWLAEWDTETVAAVVSIVAKALPDHLRPSLPEWAWTTATYYGVRTYVGTCPVCGREDQHLTDRPPTIEDQRRRVGCTDGRSCFAHYREHVYVPPPRPVRRPRR